MRLIDADALIESLGINPEDCPGCPEPEWLEELADILALAPTVDAIDRKAAIDSLADYIHNVDKVYSTGKLSMYDCKDAAASVFEELPSAERKKGKWNPHPFEKDWDVCSSCGTGCKRREREFDHLGQKSVTEYSYQYCPWCGSKMDGGENDV